MFAGQHVRERLIRAMPSFRNAWLFIAFPLFLVAAAASAGQQTADRSFFSHNARMAKIQPPMITPLVAPDPRLVQYAKLSFANQYTTTGTQTVSFGNARGIGLIAGDRFEFDLIPPSYIEHNSTAMDGFGDVATLMKYRIVSRNAKEGNYIVTALLSRCFATGSYKNGAATDSFGPAIVVGKGKGKFVAISSLGGSLPTGKIYLQGRSVAANEVIQMHAARNVWFEIEDNLTLWLGGPKDGNAQNFITPAAFYIIRPKAWKPSHPFFIVNAGMQIATSRFHTYNHNTIGELRILF